jgi:hypothetical protein
VLLLLLLLLLSDPPPPFFLLEAIVKIVVLVVIRACHSIWSALTRLLYILVILALEKVNAVAFVGEML